MPLSEQEQRLLEEMERNLYQNDADFVATVSARRGRPNYTVILVGVLIGIAGVATLVTGVILQLAIVGVLGFLVMFAGVLVALAPPRRSAGAASPAPQEFGGARAKQKKSSSFMDGLNDRWDKRQDDRGQ
ncbi:DUF3040 domain-containing protein [Glaciihabitans arcticus]|uniref:DUF3040 domain-containing protein n=1 Tax=Glaciihabitans arcticus TaxID=2668039 RepID=A0A4Q9GV91_9MICO|nr:DUF3040 domain-containing protein [Glaciihabitans arcticus]TBN56543.1 DUF3040 domain-containing protein [Glaciihabitans arcticus]